MFAQETKKFNYSQIEQRLKATKSHIRSLYITIFIIFLIFAIAKFKDPYWQANLDYDGGVYITRDSWWGFKQDWRPPRVIGGQWHFKNKNGDWQLMGLGDDDF